MSASFNQRRSPASAIHSVVLLCITAFLALSIRPAIAAPSLRERLSMDRGWRFALGDAASIEGDFGFGKGNFFGKAGEADGPADPDFDDSTWRVVRLPHDWAVEQEFVKSRNSTLCSHGYHAVGRAYPQTSIGWYRRQFFVPASDSSRRLAIHFDGVFRNCLVWLNGSYVGSNQSGYSEFQVDISEYVRFGRKNTIVVRVDATQYEGWFYEGAGIYRHVWLDKYAPLHFPEYGVYVRSDSVSRTIATVAVDADVVNQSAIPLRHMTRFTVLNEYGNVAAGTLTVENPLASGQQMTHKAKLSISSPLLWSLENPHLYTLVAELIERGKVVDRVETTFGIRTLLYDRERGFFLNGRHVELQGVCCHQDHAGVGAALPDRLQSYRIERLKEMGVNAYRTSHNPPTRELLDACDRLGMLVMDENRMLGTQPEVMSQFDRLILRDRNHPSVFIWSIANEEWAMQGTPEGRRIALAMLTRQHQLDPSRTCTYAANNGNQFEGINSVIPIRGINYMTKGDLDKYHAEHPDQPMMGTEEASTVSTRGVYANDSIRGYVSDYDLNAPAWGTTAERWWSFYAARPWLAGGFVWTGFDYRGEPTPYSWPCINSHFGIMDVCGFPKNNYYYYQAWWTEKDVIHLAPHWNWKGEEGNPIDVWCQSNADSVELFLNGISLGRKTMMPNAHLQWTVPYAPGKLEARGWRHGRSLHAAVETTGEPLSIRLTADRTTIDADNEDVSVIEVTILDGAGREIPTAGNLVEFHISGTGEIIGVGNGDPSSHEPDQCPPGHWQRRLFNGKAQVIVQAQDAEGVLTLTATSPGLQTATLRIDCRHVESKPQVE